MMARTRANTAAAQKPLVLNPSMRLSTTSTMRTFMTSEISPSVSQFSGAVINFRRSQRVALTIPRTTATTSAMTNPLTSTPGTRYAAARTARAERRSEIRNFIEKELRIGKNIIYLDSLFQEKSLH